MTTRSWSTSARSTGQVSSSATRSTLELLTYQDFLNFDKGFGRPHGPTVRLRIVGTTRRWSDDTTGLLSTTPAFEQRYAPAIAGPDGEQVNDVLLRLRDGPAGVDRYRRDLGRVSANATPPAQAPVRSRRSG